MLLGAGELGEREREREREIIMVTPPQLLETHLLSQQQLSAASSAPWLKNTRQDCYCHSSVS